MTHEAVGYRGYRQCLVLGFFPNPEFHLQALCMESRTLVLDFLFLPFRITWEIIILITRTCGLSEEDVQDKAVSVPTEPKPETSQ